MLSIVLILFLSYTFLVYSDSSKENVPTRFDVLYCPVNNCKALWLKRNDS